MIKKISLKQQGSTITYDIAPTAENVRYNEEDSVKSKIDSMVVNAGTNFLGTVEEWEALSKSEKESYVTADILNDYFYIHYHYNCPEGAEDAGGDTSVQIKKHNEDIKIQNNGFYPPLQDGVTYVFSKWNTAPDGTGIDFSEEANYSDNAPLDLYAIWES